VLIVQEQGISAGIEVMQNKKDENKSDEPSE